MFLLFFTVIYQIISHPDIHMYAIDKRAHCNE
jgi:hypothetical protein